MERARVVVRKPPLMNDKLDQLQQTISEIKKKTAKFQAVTPWNKRQVADQSHPLLKKKAS